MSLAGKFVTDKSHAGQAYTATVVSAEVCPGLDDIGICLYILGKLSNYG